MNTLAMNAKPWYREPWPWLLMAGPGIVVVAGFVTLWLAITSDDGLVSDDYYKRGLAINQVMERDRAAADLGYRARIQFSGDLRRLRVELAGPPAEIHLRLAHATRAGLDRVVQLEPRGSGVYEATIEPVVHGQWRITLEDDGGRWRLTGDWKVPGDLSLELVPRR